MATPYREGSMFAVPLRSGGYAVGIISRVSADNSGGLLGYFFGPKLAAMPNGQISSDLKSTNALRVLRFGDLLLLNQAWSVIGEITHTRQLRLQAHERA